MTNGELLVRAARDLAKLPYKYRNGGLPLDKPYQDMSEISCSQFVYAAVWKAFGETEARKYMFETDALCAASTAGHHTTLKIIPRAIAQPGDLALFQDENDQGHVMIFTDRGATIIGSCPHLRSDTNEGRQGMGYSWKFGGVEEVPLATYPVEIVTGSGFGRWRVGENAIRYW